MEDGCRYEIMTLHIFSLTELPDNENGKLETVLSSSQAARSRSHPGSPVIHSLTPVGSPKNCKISSPNPRVAAGSLRNSPRSPLVLADVRIMEEEEEEQKMRESQTKRSEDYEEDTGRSNDANKEEENGGEDGRFSPPFPRTQEGSTEAGSPIKVKKHGKKSKKKKAADGEKKKHKKKDKEKRRSKKRKDAEVGVALNTSADDLPEKASDPLMNEAICPSFDPTVPPPGHLVPGPPPRYPGQCEGHKRRLGHGVDAGRVAVSGSRFLGYNWRLRSTKR